MNVIWEGMLKVGFLIEHNARYNTRHCHIHLGKRSTTGLYSAIRFLNRAPEWISLMVGFSNLPGINCCWKELLGKLKRTSIFRSADY